MIIERTDSELLIRLPLKTDLSELQNMLDYLKYKDLTADSKANQDDIDSIVKLANDSMIKKFRSKRKII